MGTRVKLLSNGTRAFNCVWPGTQGSTLIGLDDVWDLTGSSIEKFGTGVGRVGPKGTVRCDGEEIWWKIGWN